MLDLDRHAQSWRKSDVTKFLSHFHFSHPQWPIASLRDLNPIFPGVKQTNSSFQSQFSFTSSEHSTDICRVNVIFDFLGYKVQCMQKRHRSHCRCLAHYNCTTTHLIYTKASFVFNRFQFLTSQILVNYGEEQIKSSSIDKAKHNAIYILVTKCI